KTGLATGIRPLWISNVIAAQIEAREIPDLIARHPEIARVNWDPPRPFSEAADIGSGPFVPGELDQTSWGLLDIQAPQVWNLGYFGQGVLIGNIDSGVDYNHPDLSNHIWVNPGEDLNGNGLVDTTDWNGIDDDGNGYVDDLRGWAFDTQTPNVMDADPYGHGTCTSGIVLGDGTNGNVTGVAPQAKLMMLKVWSAGESGYWEAQQYAIDMGADVITSSMSYKWYQNPKPDYATMRQNTDAELAAGLIHANSIGNQGAEQSSCPIPFNIATPGNCPPPWLHPDQILIGGVSSVLGNGAYGSNHQIKSYSGVGPSAWSLRDILNLEPNYSYQATWPTLYNDYPYQNNQFLGLLKPDLAAPTDVIATIPGNGYTYGFSGTSAATPHTGGTLCLMLSANPAATPETQARILMETATDMGPPGKDNNWGAGRLNALNAVLEVLGEISGTLVGVVSDSTTGEPIYQATVDIPGLLSMAQTDTSGHYILSGIPPGWHAVRFAAAGYDTLISPEMEFSIAVVETLSVSLTGPHIEVEPDSISVMITPDDSLQIQVTVHNSGSAALSVNFQKQGNWPPCGLFQIVQAQAIIGDAKLFGVEIAGGSFWVTGGNNESEPNYLYRLSFSGQLLDTLIQPTSPSAWGWYDLAYDGQYLYGSSGSQIEGVDLEGNLQATIAGPLSLHRALAYDAQTDHFYAADNTSDIVEINRAGTQLQSWSHNLHIQGLAWHPQDQDGYPLYVFSQDGAGALLQVSKMNPATGDIQMAADLVGSPYDQAGGAALTGELDPSRWCFVGLVQSTGDRIQVHSLNAYAPWLSIEPLTEVIPPGGNLAAIALFDGSIVPPGIYGINLAVLNNSPTPQIIIPTTLTVQYLPVGNHQPPELPSAFVAGPAYPNPFNAQTLIPLDLPHTSRVEIELFNVRGETLGFIFSGELASGRPQVRLDASHLSSGVYFFRVRAQNVSDGATFRQVGKILVLK
ncbi:MAG TPA: S8 family serine peptidase, partial [bacterium]